MAVDGKSMVFFYEIKYAVFPITPIYKVFK